MAATTGASTTAEKLDRIDSKLDCLSESITRLVEQGSSRQRAIDDHETRIRLLEGLSAKMTEVLTKQEDHESRLRKVETHSIRAALIQGGLQVIGYAIAGYLIANAMGIIFP